MGKARLSVAQILRWADAHHERTGRWPGAHSGPVAGAAGEHWGSIESALRHGWRGQPGGDSLARLLAEHRGRRTRAALPPLTEAQILAWADAHHRHTGTWPSAAAGEVLGAPGENWRGIDQALHSGYRGLPRGDSLARLLVRHGRRAALWGTGRWTAAEDEWVRTLSPKEAARRTGRPLAAVYQRRYRLRVPDDRKQG
jgi:hypothetical protein